MNVPELMTVKDFLKAFSISRTSFYQEINAGRLRVVKYGRSTRVARMDAEAWLLALRANADEGQVH